MARTENASGNAIKSGELTRNSPRLVMLSKRTESRDTPLRRAVAESERRTRRTKWRVCVVRLKDTGSLRRRSYPASSGVSARCLVRLCATINRSPIFVREPRAKGVRGGRSAVRVGSSTRKTLGPDQRLLAEVLIVASKYGGYTPSYVFLVYNCVGSITAAADIAYFVTTRKGADHCRYS